MNDLIKQAALKTDYSLIAFSIMKSIIIGSAPIGVSENRRWWAGAEG